MYKIEIGVFEGDRQIFKIDEDGFICRDENGEAIVESINTNRPFIGVISEVLNASEACKKLKLLLMAEFKSWHDEKILSTFEHTEDNPKTLVLEWTENYHYGFRLTKVDA